MQREMDRMFENVSRGFDPLPFSDRRGVFTPSMNVVETDPEVKVTVELPGIDEKDIEVSLEKDVLTVCGENKEEGAENAKSYSLLERSSGSFSRSISLPCEVDENRVNAAFKQGVLNITLPKSRQVLKETRKIPVRSE